MKDTCGENSEVTIASDTVGLRIEVTWGDTIGDGCAQAELQPRDGTVYHTMTDKS